jgi:hypothetical protein
MKSILAQITLVYVFLIYGQSHNLLVDFSLCCTTKNLN